MKDLFKKIKNIFEKGKMKNPDIINPHKHWTILLRVFFTVVIIMIISSLYLLYKIKDEQITDVALPTIETPKLTEENLLKEVSDTFQQKDEKEKEIINTRPQFHDPSL